MSLLSTVDPWDAVASGYAEITMKLFQTYADQAIDLVGLQKNDHVLDIACGPGTLALSAAKQVQQVKAIDFSAAMIEIFQNTIEQHKINNIDLYCGDAQDLPYDDDSFNAAFSMFGLMFFPDRAKAYLEIKRCLKPGGKILISSWAPISDSPAMKLIFGALRAINPQMPDAKTDIASLENPDVVVAELTQAGFKHAEVHRITVPYEITNIQNYWEEMVKGNAFLVMMKNNCSEQEWQEKTNIALQHLYDTIVVVPVSLSVDAWFGLASK